MDKLAEAKRVFDIEINALKKTRDVLDEAFIRILDLITNCEGKVVITGMGKPGHIATKLAATFSSLGTPSFCLHPGEAMHGDLGMISKNDVVIAISYSGESDEIIQIVPNIRLIGATLVAITANNNSTLAREADVTQILPEFEEACYLGLAPTSSTTAELCYGDALAVVASRVYGFKKEDFGKVHPAGTLGKKLILQVADLMARDEENAVIGENASLKEAIVELSKKGLGVVNIVADNGSLLGIITDGDLRRQLEKGADIYNLQAIDIMVASPITIEKDELAIRALNIMREKNVTCLPVLNHGCLVGTIRLQAILGAGIVG